LISFFGNKDPTRNNAFTPGGVLARFPLSEQAGISRLVAFVDFATTASPLKGLIYADSAGNPGVLLGVTSPVLTPKSAYVVLPFTTPVDLASGNYWIGVVGQDIDGSIAFNDAAAGSPTFTTATINYNTPGSTSGESIQSGALLIYAEYGQEDAGKPKRPRRKRRLQVEIEGTVFAVESAEEADALIAQAREVAEQKAAEDARTVVRKRRTAARRDRKPLRLDSIQLDTPYVKAVSDESAELAQRIQAQLDAVYAAAAQEAELALHMYMARLLDEEEAIALILLD